ncbi:amidohydrolase family protein [Miniphocaeibacter halophilus]|uniref:Amidohydrolase n=1 Tax=Miniphocaeibacter halophilus TaxID=2931922 RepID=A0AC61MRT5_9FIRM|nr:amidohydrolase [Miniphocaeibacter halophilus]QQK08390.1 amidohydrolase [Miniphocaeibacter halophilus]
MIDILIKNGIIVTVNSKREILYNGALAIKDNRIIDVGENKSLTNKYTDVKKTIDAKGKVVFPGFINTHTHLFQSLLKGLGDDMELHHWLSDMMFQAAIYLTEENVYYGAMSGGIEAIKSGVTTTVDYMHTHSKPKLTDSIVEAYKDLKIRGIIGRGMINTGNEFGTPLELTQDIKTVEEDLYRLFDRYHNIENGRIQIGTSPSSVWAATDEMLKRVYDITNEYNALFAVHLSETDFNNVASNKIHGKDDFDTLIDLGINGENVLMVHCVVLNDKQLLKAKEYNMKVSHNVVSNMYLASGTAPITKMIEMGLTVGLGVDGAASNNSQDIIETMKITALQQKVKTLDPVSITAEKVLEMATIDGAKAIGLDKEIGSIEIGKKADLLVFNPMLNPKAIPMHNPVSTLVYSSGVENVETVIIDGNIVMENRKILTLDSEEETLKKIQNSAEDLCSRGNITNRMSGHKWNR